MDNPLSLEKRIESLDGAVLTPIVQGATGCSGTLTHWQATQLHITVGGLSPSLVYRFTGGIQGKDDELPWSLILKVTLPALAGKDLMFNEAADFEREYAFYRSGLAGEFPAGFRAAHCYAQFEQTGSTGQSEYWIWLEDLGEVASREWSAEDYYQAALGFGKFNGIYLNGQPQTKESWLKTDRFRKYLQMTGPSFQRLFSQRDLPVIRSLFPPAIVDSLAKMWQDREQHLAVLDRLPQTLCHGDAQFSNLFLVPTSGGELGTVAIDWSGIGRASIGYDPAQMLMLALIRSDYAQSLAIEAAIFQGYLDGLRAAGWQGDPRLTRLGFTSAMLKVRATFVMRLLSTVSDNGEVSGWFKRALQERGQSLEQWCESKGWLQPYLRSVFEESLELRAHLL